MAATRSRTSSFSRNQSTSPLSQIPGIKPGPNGVTYVSSGIPDLDKILGGGFPLGSLVMIMEDAEAPHHLLLLRNFMSQGLVHNQPLLYASPSKDPRAFLGTLPSPVLSKDEKSLQKIAWQYKKYFGENQQNLDRNATEYCNEFDLRKPLERHILNAQRIECFSIQESPSLSAFRDRCSSFLTQTSRNDGGTICPGRIAIQSFCAPQCCYSEMVSEKHDTLLAVRAIPDEDKDLAKLLTGYQDMVGFLHVHKVAQINTQVPVILEATTFSIKLQRRRSLVLERLNQAPVDGSSGSSHDVSGSCGGGSIISMMKTKVWVFNPGRCLVQDLEFVLSNMIYEILGFCIRRGTSRT
ncbi:hypothetical protein MKW98_001390 [Papaver atlanticum]|uniref:Elongator complex protein 4 n=1 Tax=Papaver atlanticum TaxID=357466 RepID=A0AAD4SS62_9MAGN|nr:hypothetical protein MKW98_001390 [Papaver atlanticum]